MRLTLAVSRGRKVFVAIVDSGVTEQQSVPNVARMVKEAKVRMARDRARKANQVKGKLTTARRKVNAKVTGGKQARHLKGIAVTVGNGVTWKKIVQEKHRPRVKAKVRVVSMNLKQVDQKTLHLADFVCARLETVTTLTGSGTIIAR